MPFIIDDVSPAQSQIQYSPDLCACNHEFASPGTSLLGVFACKHKLVPFSLTWVQAYFSREKNGNNLHVHQIIPDQRCEKQHCADCLACGKALRLQLLNQAVLKWLFISDK